MVDKNKRKLFTVKKYSKYQWIGFGDVEEEKIFQNLSTSYQQIVDNVGKDTHTTHKGLYPQFFPSFPQKIP